MSYPAIAGPRLGGAVSRPGINRKNHSKKNNAPQSGAGRAMKFYIFNSIKKSQNKSILTNRALNFQIAASGDKTGNGAESASENKQNREQLKKT